MTHLSRTARQFACRFPHSAQNAPYIITANDAGWQNIAEVNKIAAICIREKKLLVVRNKGETVFFALGGRIEPGETELECLKREVQEELGCNIKNPKHFATFEGRSHDGTKSLNMSCYFVELEGEIKACSEIEETAWIDKDYSKKGIKVAPMLELNIIPALIKHKLL